MADDDQVDQDEIENLFAQARSESSPPQDEPKDQAASAPGERSDTGLEQDEIEALLESTPAAPSPATGKSVEAVQHKTEPSFAQTSGVGDAAGSVAQNDIELLLNQAQEALASIDGDKSELPPGAKTFRFKDFVGTPASKEAATLELMRDVELDLNIELGRTHMQLEDVLRLQKGAVVTLDKLAGDPVDIFVNGRLIARGEVLVLNDNFCVRVAELIVGESACA